MYDSHIYCKEYKELKDYIVDILNGEIENYDVEKLIVNFYSEKGTDFVLLLGENNEIHQINF